MSNDEATAMLALNQANSCLKTAYDALKRLDQKQAARLVKEMGEDTLELAAAIIRGAHKAEVVS